MYRFNFTSRSRSNLVEFLKLLSLLVFAYAYSYILDIKKFCLLGVYLLTIVTHVLISVKINSFYSARASIPQSVVFLFLCLQGV